MSPSDLGRLGGFGKEMTTYDSRALEIILSDPDFISGLDDDLRIAIDLQRKLDLEERSKSHAAGEASAEYPGSLPPPVQIDSASCKNGVQSNFRRFRDHTSSHFNDRKSRSPLRSLPANIAKLKETQLGQLIQRGIENKEARKRAQQQEELNYENQSDLERPKNIANLKETQLGQLIQRGIDIKEARKLARKRAQQKEKFNYENQSDQDIIDELERIKQEAEALCMNKIKDHLDLFLHHNPNCSYEEWIEDLHPENAHEGKLLQGLGKIIDHRFYVEDSDHRRLWNDHAAAVPTESPTMSDKIEDSSMVGTGRRAREHVPARPVDFNDSDDDSASGTSRNITDFLDNNEEEGGDGENADDHCSSSQGPADLTKDLIIFD